MLCDYDRETFRCRLCGHQAKRLPTYRNCTATTIRLPRPMLGDALAAVLAAVGVTDARVAAWLGKKSCGCSGRRAWLNRWGVLAVDRLERWLNAYRRFCLGD